MTEIKNCYNGREMHETTALLIPFLIFTGAAVIATLALFARQAMLVAYIVLGLLLGPAVLGIVDGESEAMHVASNIGIVFLLFLLGLDLSPVKLVKVMRSIAVPTLVSCMLFALPGAAFGYALGVDVLSAVVLAITTMFSSTIIGLKLLPTTVLHHKPTGEIIIGILLIQDLIAIIALLALRFLSGMDLEAPVTGIKLLSLPVMIAVAYLVQKHILIKLLARFDKIKEYVFLMVIGWCFGIAQMTASLGLSYEIGAFLAGVLVATNPIAIYVADSLKPLRDFFLVIFFFALGSSIHLEFLQEVLVPSILLAGILLLFKPLVFQWLLIKSGEEKERAKEVGLRLGQGSEFSLLIIILAFQLEVVNNWVFHLIQVTMLITFIVSPYLIVVKYPTPIAISDSLRRD